MYVDGFPLDFLCLCYILLKNMFLLIFVVVKSVCTCKITWVLIIFLHIQVCVMFFLFAYNYPFSSISIITHCTRCGCVPTQCGCVSTPYGAGSDQWVVPVRVTYSTTLTTHCLPHPLTTSQFTPGNDSFSLPPPSLPLFCLSFMIPSLNDLFPFLFPSFSFQLLLIYILIL